MIVIVELLLPIIAARPAIAVNQLEAVRATLRTFEIIVDGVEVMHGNGLNNCVELTADSVFGGCGATRRR